MSSLPPLPYRVPFDLAKLGDNDVSVTLKPATEIRTAIAAWAGIDALTAFSAEVRLSRLAPTAYRYEAALKAALRQSCVVTLEPVPSRLNLDIMRLYQIAVPVRRGTSVSAFFAAEDDAEALTGTLIDLAAPLLEELLLAIDPYPRVPGVSFGEPAEEKPASESPFAVLEVLKARLPSSRRKKR